jgi:hypothetical protein
VSVNVTREFDFDMFEKRRIIKLAGLAVLAGLA